MRILVVSQYWFPEEGVPQRRWRWLSELLASDGHELMVVAPPSNYRRNVTLKEWFKFRGFQSRLESETGPAGERILRSGYLPFRGSLTMKALNQATVALGSISALILDRSTFNDWNPDLVIGTVPALPTALVAFFASKRFGVPYVIDLRDAWPDLLSQSDQWNAGLERKSIRERLFGLGLTGVVVAVAERVLNAIIFGARSIIVTSDYLGKGLRKSLDVSSEDSRVVTIRNVFPRNELREKKYRVVDDEIKSRELRVLYAGTVGRAQDLKNAIAAVEIAKDRGLRIYLCIVGTGDALQAVKGAASTLGDMITIHERVPLDMINDYYDWADTALVHLADWEPLQRAVPSKTYELMERELHICVVANGETPVLVQELHAGHAVPPSKPELLVALWEKLILDPSLLTPNSKAKSWVLSQRKDVTPSQLRKLLVRCFND